MKKEEFRLKGKMFNSFSNIFKGKFAEIIPMLIVIFFAFIAGVALLHSGLPPTHDGEYHVIRFYEFDKVLRDGNFYPRWAPDLNYTLGVPLFNYVYPFPNYFASFLHSFGFGFIATFKLNMFFAVVFGAVFFYLWVRIFWGNIGGIVSSVFYTFSPYHFLDIYIRGSVGEVWALAFFPAFLWSITIFIKERNKKFGILSSVFLALIIFSHNILALMFFIFAFFYMLFLFYGLVNKIFKISFTRPIFNTFLYILIGVGISSIFWLPALLEERFVTGLQIYNIENNFADLYQLLIPSWGTGFSGKELGNQMSFQIGIANLFAVIFSFFILFLIRPNHAPTINIKNQRSDIKNNFKYQKQVILFFLICFLIVFFLMLKVSLPVWKIIPRMNYFQFPWRFLSLEILITSFLAGSLFVSSKSLSSIKAKILFIFMIILPIILSWNYTKPAYYHNRTDNHYLTRPNFIYGTNSVGDYFNTIWAKKADNLPKRKIQENANIEILSASIKTTYYKFNILAKENTQIIFNTAYFPGWKASIDGKEWLIEPDKEGLISFSVSKGQHSIEVKLMDTLIQTISKIISILSIVLVFSIMISFKYKAVLRLKK